MSFYGPDIAFRAIYDLLTAYMLVLLLRWLGPWIAYDLRESRFRFLCRLTDPHIMALRRVLPHMGPMDFGPIAAIFSVWLARSLALLLVR